MAIAYDTSSIGTLANPATGITVAITPTAGSDMIVVAAGGIPTTDKLTTIKYDGTDMDAVGTFQNGDGRGCYLHYLAIGTGPGTAKNVVIVGGSDAWQMGLATYTGVDQTTPVDVSTQNSGTGASLYTDDLTTTVDGCFIVGSLRSGTSIDTYNDTTVRQTANGLSLFEDASGTTASTVTVEMDITGAGTASCGWVLAAFQPVAAAGSLIKSVNGVLRANIKSWNGVILE